MFTVAFKSIEICFEVLKLQYIFIWLQSDITLSDLKYEYDSTA